MTNPTLIFEKVRTDNLQEFIDTINRGAYIVILEGQGLRSWNLGELIEMLKAKRYHVKYFVHPSGNHLKVMRSITPMN